MTDPSFHEYMRTNLDQSNILDILDILDRSFNFKDRSNFSLYLSKTVYDEWRRFCRVHKLSTAELIEKALIYAMLTIPNKNALIQVELPQKTNMEQNVSERLQEIICIDELEIFLKKVKNLNSGLHVNRKRELMGIIKECNKVKSMSPKLEALIGEALSYLD